jgi:hypothetical protein
MTRRITKHGLAKNEPQHLFSESATRATPFELGKNGFGTDGSQRGEIARHTKRLIKERSRNAAPG